MNKVFKFTAVSTLAVFLAASAGDLSARDLKAGAEPVTTEGSLPYNGGDPAAAANAAIIEAQKNAVSAVAELFIDPVAKAEKYELFRQNLLKTPQLYVKKHKVLSQGAEGAFYKVKIKAYVYVDKVNSALKGLQLSAQPGRNRKAALMAGEYFNARPSAAGDFANAFAGYFKGRDTLFFADLKAPATGWTLPQSWLDEERNSADVSAFFDAASAAGAGLVFLCKAEALPLSAAQNAQPGFYPARAEARMKIFETSGKRISEVSSQANALDVSEEAAFKKALAAAGELLAAELAGRLDKILRPEIPVTLRVSGLPAVEAARKLKEAVEKLDIAGAAFESYGGGTAVMTVMLKRPDAHEFASALLRTGVFVMDLESVSQLEAVFSIRSR
ncbi:MAG: hypothetical protein HY796_09975 [Elusimicrobia bacterium]|nr:hypothetical protein [Elusimicrobiota bacterium]